MPDIPGIIISITSPILEIDSKFANCPLKTVIAPAKHSDVSTAMTPI